MKNEKCYDDIEQTGGYINHLVWIAGQLESSGLIDLVEDMQEDDIRDCFPDFDLDNYNGDGNDLKEYLGSYGKLGFLAQCHFPHQSNFHFPPGSNTPTSWSSSSGACTIYWAYDETLSGLIKKMAKIGRSHHKREYTRELKSQNTV